MHLNNNAQLVLLATSHGVNHIYQLLTPVVLPAITAEYGLSNFTAGALLACFLVAYCLLPALSGYLAKTFSRKILLSAGFALTALSFLAMGFVDNIALFALLLFAAGTGGSTYHPNGVPYLAEVYPSNRGQMLGLHQTGGAIGSFIAPLLAGALVLNLGWKPALIVLSIPGIALSLLLHFSISQGQLRETLVQNQPSKTSTNKQSIYGSVLLFMAAAFIYVLGQRGTDAFANQYFTYGRGIENLLEASLLFAALKVAGLFSAPICGKLSDIYDRKKVLVALVIIESVSLYVITVTPTALLLVPCIIFGFAAFGLLGVGEALLADIVPAAHRNAIFGINFTINFSSAPLLSLALGVIADQYSFDTGFALLSALMPLSILLLLKIKSPAQQKACSSITGVTH